MAASSALQESESASGGEGQHLSVPTFQIGSRQLKLGARFKLYSIGDGAVEKKKSANRGAFISDYIF
jgi:hypothetical protein